MRILRNQQRRSGTAAVEFAVVAPFLLMLLVGVWEFGRIIEVHQLLTNAARESGRLVSTGRYPQSQVEAYARKYLQRSGLSASAANSATITIVNISGERDPQTAKQLDRFRVTVSLQYSAVSWIDLPGFAGPETVLTSTVDWKSTRDLPIEVVSDIPLN